MKCRRCSEQAAVALPSHNTAFCPDCFIEFFRRQVERGIEQYSLFTKESRILTALSGGKDSLSLMLVLSSLGYKVTGLHIDLGIGESSLAARKTVEAFCSKHGLELLVCEMQAQGLPIPLVKQHIRRPICSVCGKIKRHYFNKIALEQGFDIVATGHNLDDEVARLFSNVLRWDKDYLAGQGPHSPALPGFAARAKPLWRLTEFELANYAFLMGIETHYAPCPYSAGATFSVHKKLWYELEENMPGRKIEFYQGFLEKARASFSAGHEARQESLHACPGCGSPSSEALCSLCRLRAMIAEKEAGAVEKA